MTVKNKIKIGVSSCIMGEAVRYDGTDKLIPQITDLLKIEYTLVSLCPEMAIGMGVPRPPIHLVDTETGIQVVAVANMNDNKTIALSNYAASVVEKHNDICGYIFKKNSPSCGTKEVKVLNKQGSYDLVGQGIYAQTIMQALPQLSVIDEEDFLNEQLRNEFLLKVNEYAKRFL